MPTAGYAVHGDIAVVTLENPPVNTLAHGVRKGIAEGLEKALADPNVKAIVLTGAGNAFSGGAEIREFNTPVAMATPHLREVIAHARREHEAGDRGDPQGRDGRRARARARLPLPHRRARRAARAARGEARHPARRRRHAAPAARDRRESGARHDRLGQPGRLGQGARPGWSTRSPQGDLLPAALGVRAQGRGGEAAAAPAARREGEARRRRRGVLRRGAEARREGIARLPRPAEDRRLRRGGGEPAGRRGPQVRARALRGAGRHDRVESDAPRVLRRAGGGEDPGRARNDAGPRGEEGRDRRRRHDGRRHRHGVRQRRVPGDASGGQAAKRSIAVSTRSARTTRRPCRRGASRRTRWTGAWRASRPRSTTARSATPTS